MFLEKHQSVLDRRVYNCHGNKPNADLSSSVLPVWMLQNLRAPLNLSLSSLPFAYFNLQSPACALNECLILFWHVGWKSQMQ